MRKLLVLLVCVIMTCGVAIAKGPEVIDVSIVGEGVGNGGRPILIATCQAKKADKVVDDDFRRCAVKGIFFKGYADKSNTTAFDASTSHPSLLPPDAEAGYADYFNDFFNSGAYASYVDVIPDTRRVMKNGKVYNVSSAVQVNVPELRRKLEKDGIIKSLKSGW